MAKPARGTYRPAERRLIERLTTPRKVQEWLHGLPYNTEPRGPTYRTLRGVVRTGTAHCGEAALAAAAILEQHDWPTRLLVLDSVDGLGHVLFLFQERGLYGTVGRSRDPGLHGRQPRYANLSTLVRSYIDPYIDLTGCVTGWTVFDLADLPPRIDWRASDGNVFAFERILNELPLTKLHVPRERVQRWRARYRRFRDQNPGRKPTFYANRKLWL